MFYLEKECSKPKRMNYANVSSSQGSSSDNVISSSISFSLSLFCENADIIEEIRRWMSKINWIYVLNYYISYSNTLSFSFIEF